MDKSFSAKQLPAPLREFYAAIQNDLVVIEQKLHDFLDSKNPFIKRVVDHGFRLGGKRMRPALHLLFAQMAGSISAEHYVIGAALETIHTASLVHDDILDEALTKYAHLGGLLKTKRPLKQGMHTFGHITAFPCVKQPEGSQKEAPYIRCGRTYATTIT